MPHQKWTKNGPAHLVCAAHLAKRSLKWIHLVEFTLVGCIPGLGDGPAELHRRFHVFSEEVVGTDTRATSD